MSLTATDLQDIRTIVREEVRGIVGDEISTQLAPIERRLTTIETKLDNIEGRLIALERDVKELYQMVADLQKAAPTDKSFKQLSVEAKLFRLNSELLATAKQAGITLPRA